MRLHIGIDDTDSPKGGCTTYIGALLVGQLAGLGVRFLDYPNLIRLNPNIPWKTRGNGAICLRIRGDDDQIAESARIATSILEENAHLKDRNTHPGLVFLRGDVPDAFSKFSKVVIQDIASKDDALRLIKKFGAEAVGLKKGRGIIGALAAIGNKLDRYDYTYELIAYRTPTNRGTRREVDEDSVIIMDKLTRPLTFNNVDHEVGRVLITPRGPDPVMYGIRGESPEVVWSAHRMVRTGEDIERWVIYRTNQGTDAHFPSPCRVRDVRPHRPVVVAGRVVRAPRTIMGGHVIFTIGDRSGEIDCAAYEPTGHFRNVMGKLSDGDGVEVYGGVRQRAPKHSITINLERVRVTRTVDKFVFKNPLCPKCGKRMESAGRNKGFRCDRCGLRSRTIEKIVMREDGGIRPGLYVTPPRARRHLSKPISRYGLEREGAPTTLFKLWHAP